MIYTITDIKRNKKDALITLNDDFSILIALKSLKKINIGDDVNLIDIVSDGREYLYDKAINLSYNYLSYAMRTKKEMENYLYDKHFHSSIVREVVKKLEEYKFIDDISYIKIFSRNKMEALDGKNKIRTSLMKKGVDKDTIDEVFEDIFTYEKERDLTFKFIYKNKDKYKNCFYKEKVDKMLAMGVRKGYSSSLLISAINEIVEDNIVDEDKLKLKIEKKAMQILRKEKDLKKARYKLFSYFYAKGADDGILNSVWNEIVSE